MEQDCVVRRALIRTWFLIVTPTEMACAKVSSNGSYNDIITRAVTLVLRDEEFSLPSVPARSAREKAESC